MADAQGAPLMELSAGQLSLFPLPVIVYDPQTLRIHDVNGLAIAQYGYSREEFQALGLDGTVVEGERNRVVSFVGTLGENRWARSEWNMQRRDGTAFPATSFSCALHWNGRPARLVAVEDMSDVRAKDVALAESEALFRQTMNAAQVGIFVLQDFRFRYVNPTLCRWFGYAVEEMVDRLGPLDLIVADEREFVLDQMRRRAAGEPGKQYVITCLRKDGSTFPGTILGAPSSFRNKPASVGTLVDLTEIRQAEEQIRKLAFFDSLTGLPNRILLADRTAQAIVRAEREASSVALLFIDLDRFKNVNDSLGHSVGDQLLKGVAERLAMLVRKSDTLARLGGDEFVLLLGDATLEGVGEVVRKVIAQFAAPFAVDSHELSVTPSVGISLYPDDGANLEALLRSADLAMYQAKEKGRNTYRFYTPAMNEDLVERVTLERELRLAFEHGELALHYQPIVRIDDGRIVGAEALMRWTSPVLGVVSPVKFIPIAEVSGLIVPIGAWAIAEACRQNREWRESGLPEIAINVNLSAVQFFRGDFVDSVGAILSSSGLPGNGVALEITESVAMEDVEATVDALIRLNDMGISLSIDDFGTGYSSLANLKRFPIASLKIDRSFIRGIIDAEDDRVIAGTIVSMGHSLRLEVLAEGVETEDQRRLLQAQGCDLVQGFLFSPAVPAAEFAAMLAREFIAPAGSGSG